MKEQIAKVQNNLIGSLAGAGLAYFAAKKYGKVTNMYALVGIAIAGVLAGANIQSGIKAKNSAPTIGTTKPAGKPASPAK
jgi:outer membrane lipoprotein SlyB